MSLKGLIREIAVLDNVYTFKRENNTTNKEIYTFTTESGIDYVVGFYYTGDDTWIVGFDSVGNRGNKEVRAEKILNTVFKIVDEFYKDNREFVNILVFHADQKRHRIYEYYVKKIFPSVKINPDGYDPNAFVVEII